MKPTFGSKVACNRPASTPARPARAPASSQVKRTTRSTFTPEIEARSASSDNARMDLPTAVRASTNAATSSATSEMTMETICVRESRTPWKSYTWKMSTS